LLWRCFTRIAAQNEQRGVLDIKMRQQDRVDLADQLVAIRLELLAVGANAVGKMPALFMSGRG
jgi:hypothetical protein